MLYGSLWDPEEEVKMNVGAYVDEVGSISFLLVQSTIALGKYNSTHAVYGNCLYIFVKQTSSLMQYIRSPLLLP